MSSDIPIAFVTSNFQTNPFPEKAGPGSEGSTRVGACQAPSSQWMLRTPQTKFSAAERSCPRVTHQHPEEQQCLRESPLGLTTSICRRQQKLFY